MLVLYAYDAESPEELTIHENDVVTVITEASPLSSTSSLRSFLRFRSFIQIFKFKFK
jgi:hypothetical protein